MKNNDILFSFGCEFPDGRLCEESSGKYYKLREAIKLSEELGRPLTSQEYETFRIDSKEH